MTAQTMTDKDMLHDLLVLEKDIVKSYASYMVEASCENLRNVLNKNFKDSSGDQFQVFYSMTSRDMYPVKEAPAPEVAQAKKKFTDVSNQLS